MKIEDVKNLVAQEDSAGRDASVRQLYPDEPGVRALFAVELWEVEPGGMATWQPQGEEQLVFILSGSGELSGPGDGAATGLVRADSVVQLGPHESLALRNTGGERLRALVTTSLLAWSGRALGIAPGAGREKQQSPARGREITQEAVAPQPSRRPRVEETRPTPPPESPPQEAEAPPPDISGLMKRGSDLVGAPRVERKRPELEPEPVPQVEEQPQAEGEAAEEQGQLMELSIVFDGGSRGNPGQGYGSYMVQAPGRKPVIKRVELGDNYTNNQAEYDTLIACLEYVIERLTATERTPQVAALDIKSDSDLLVNQLNGQFKVKDAGIRKRHEQAIALLAQFGNWMITWHPRDESVRLLGH